MTFVSFNLDYIMQIMESLYVELVLDMVPIF